MTAKLRFVILADPADRARAADLLMASGDPALADIGAQLLDRHQEAAKSAELVRELAQAYRHMPSKRQMALRLYAELRRYAAGAWLRDRLLDELPDPLSRRAALWRLLRLRAGHFPSLGHLERILSG